MTTTRKRAAALAGLFLLLLAPAARAASGIDAIVDSVMKAYGGREALAKVRGYRAEGALTSSLRGKGPFVRIFSRPDRLRVDLAYPDHPESRVLDGKQGWRSDGKGGMAKSEGFLLDSMRLQAARSDVPWMLDERRADFTLLPTVADGKLQPLQVSLGPGLTLKVYVELSSGRVVRTMTSLDLPGMKTEFATDYTDFRTVDGVLFPFRELNFAAGQTTGDTIIEKIVVNPPLKGTEFQP